MLGGGQRAVATWLAPVALVVVTTVALLAQLGERASVSVQQCVTGGGFARLGVGIALLHTDSTCPDGVAMGPANQQVIGIVVMIALPVLLAHLVGLAAGVGIAARLHRMVRAVLAMILPSLRVAAPLPSTPQPARPVEAVLRRPTTAAVVGGPLRRGPPRVRFA